MAHTVIGNSLRTTRYVQMGQPSQVSQWTKGRWCQSHAPVQLQLFEGWHELQSWDVADQRALAQVNGGDMGKLWQHQYVLVACPIHVAGQPARTQMMVLSR